MELRLHQHFDIEFFKFEHDGAEYIVGIGNLKNDGGCDIFYPRAGKNYILVLYEGSFYQFHVNEFTNDFGLSYIAEKLLCTVYEADIIRKFIYHIYEIDQVKSLLSGQGSGKNPLINDIEKL